MHTVCCRKWSDNKGQRNAESLFPKTLRSSASCHDLLDITTYNPPMKIDNSLRVPSNDCFDGGILLGDPKKPEVTGISPNKGSVEGGTKVTIRGTNLGINKEDVVGLFICGANVLATLEYVAPTKLTCVTKAWRPCVGTVTVETQSGGKGSSLVQFTFVDTDHSRLGSTDSPTQSGSTEAIVRRAESLKSDSAERKFTESRSRPDIARSLKARSMLDLSFQSTEMSAKEFLCPEVTGISPMEGFVDRVTKLTIRGSNLGSSKSDISCLTVCDFNCLETVEYENSSKLVCKVGPVLAASSGKVIVETLSGGRGSSMVEFQFVDAVPEGIPLLTTLTLPSNDSNENQKGDYYLLFSTLYTVN